MLRTRSLLQHSVAISIAIVFPIAGAACGGQVVSLGANQSPLTEVDPSAVSGTVPACGQNAAHPNVCCHAEVGTASTCGVHRGAPFQACDDGWKTYPDPRECCDLSNPASCAPPPPVPVDPPPVTCGYACPPGWFSGGEGSCCRTFADGSGECFASAGTGGSDGGVYVDGGSAPDSGTTGCTTVPPHPTPMDAGIYDGGAYPDSGDIDGGSYPDAGEYDGGTCVDPSPPPYPPPPSPVPMPSPPCDLTCPPGWVRAQGAPDVCCRDEGFGIFECFSQAGGGPNPPVPGPTPADAGPPTTVDAGVAPGRACYGSSGGDCGCSEDIGGQHYEIKCSDSSSSCTCISSSGAQTPITGRKVCNGGGAQSLGSVWTDDCRFP